MSSKKIILNSNKNFEIIDITSKINREIDIESGIANIFSKHSTLAIVVNENESGLLADLELMLSDLVSDKYSWQHDRIDNNAKSHLKSFLLSSSETIPISNGKLDLGTWQSVFFIELDGPRKNRAVNLTFISD
ncbi:secondary thiamine-phosphate synthase enzyme YjbQ [uncultured Methanobrevibacter sp.]|uniref:secondary thiamine-phosphate synthase enzyme YjbQ n=2 Tax=uncultured Methanobrevibacter sp. TaxID=253161 RepID=UPI0025CD79B6|nr:secondary thiamine-phosphate synthase enzyme YjbQ [uncultured Methanobrevibacter sp.]